MSFCQGRLIYIKKKLSWSTRSWKGKLLANVNFSKNWIEMAVIPWILSLLSLFFHEWDSASGLKRIPKFPFLSMEIYQTQTMGIRDTSSSFESRHLHLNLYHFTPVIFLSLLSEILESWFTWQELNVCISRWDRFSTS